MEKAHASPMAILHKTTCSYVFDRDVPMVAPLHMRADTMVNVFRLYRSEAIPAPSDAIANSDVKAMLAKRPYCD